MCLPAPRISTFLLLILISVAVGSDLRIGQHLPNADVISISLEEHEGAPDYVLSYSKTYPGDNYRVISQLDIRDEARAPAGMRHAALVAGGPGHTYATIAYTAGRYTRMRFNVTIYGKTPPFKVIP